MDIVLVFRVTTQGNASIVFEWSVQKRQVVVPFAVVACDVVEIIHVQNEGRTVALLVSVLELVAELQIGSWQKRLTIG